MPDPYVPTDAPQSDRPADVSAIATELLDALHSQANAANVAGMARFGIASAGTLGVSMPVVRGLARDARRDLRRDDPALHELAALLWDCGVHEARIMAAIVEVPALMTPAQADAWACDLDSWDVCDQLCLNALRKTTFAWDLPGLWAGREETFVKRAGFVVAATLAVHDKSAAPEKFGALLSLCERECTDGRNDVKKGINWAVRQIGKRDAECHALAVQSAERMLAAHPESTAARWVARGALRELRRYS